MTITPSLAARSSYLEGYILMKILKIGAVATISAMMAIAPVAANDVEFTLVNDSSYILTYFYASPSSDDSWGDDLLDEVGILEPGYEGTVFIGDGSDECIYDFRFETAEGPELEVAEIDICELESYTLVDE